MKTISKHKLGITVSDDVLNILAVLKAMGVIPNATPEGYLLSEAALSAALAGAYTGGAERQRVAEEETSAKQRGHLPSSFYFMAGIIIGLTIGWLLR